jgi:imidazolonepropionase-like amidohydrolase
MRFALALFAAFSALAQPAGAADLAIVGAKIYPAPNLLAVDDGTVLIHNGKIAKVGRTCVSDPAWQRSTPAEPFSLPASGTTTSI